MSIVDHLASKEDGVKSGVLDHAACWIIILGPLEEEHQTIHWFQLSKVLLVKTVEFLHLIVTISLDVSVIVVTWRPVTPNLWISSVNTPGSDSMRHQFPASDMF